MRFRRRSRPSTPLTHRNRRQNTVCWNIDDEDECASSSGCKWSSAYGFDFCDEGTSDDDDNSGAQATTTEVAATTTEASQEEATTVDSGKTAGTEAPGCNKKGDSGEWTTTPTMTETWTTPEPNCTTFESADGCPEERCEWEYDDPCAAALASDAEGCPTEEHECEWIVNCDGFGDEDGCPPEECFWEVNCEAHAEDECPREECCASDEWEEMAPTEFLDRSCKPQTYCMYKKIPAVGEKRSTLIVGAMEVTTPTKYSDRECVPITLCDSELEYETKEPVLVASGYPDSVDQPLHAISDRECSPLANCSATEFQVASATHATDRVCRPLSVECELGNEYESVSPTPTSDRACRPLSRECVVGEHMTANYTATTDRVCTICERGSIDHDRDPLTPCAHCPGGSFQDEAGRTSCRPSTNVCPIGTWQVTATNRSHERTCQYCDGVTQYQDQAGQPACKNVSTCPAGTRVTALHSVTADTQCEPCDGVATYQDQAHQALCIPVAPVCGFGFYQLFASTPKSNRVCVPCDEGSFQDEKDQEECKPVQQCYAGSVEFKGPTTVADRICIKCDGVTGFQDQNFTKACNPVSSCNAKTEFVQEDATATSDVQCRSLTVCDDNTFATGYSNVTSDRMCSTHRECEWPAEYEFQAPTSSTDRICAETRDCRKGHFEVEAPIFGSGDGVGSDRVCEKCTRCSSYGEFQVQACNSTVDAICEQCSACTAGDTFEQRACGATEDRVCAACTTCSGSVVNTALGPVYVGEFASETCTLEEDTTCTPCSHCKPWEVETQQCTATSDTVCTPKCGFDVPDGTGGLVWNRREYNEGDACLPVSRCEFRDQFREAAATPASNIVCTNFTECNSYDFVEVTQATTPAAATTPGMSLEENERIMSAACSIRIIGGGENTKAQCEVDSLCMWNSADRRDRRQEDASEGSGDAAAAPAPAAGTCDLNPEWLKTTTTTKAGQTTEAPVLRLELIRLQYEIAAKTKTSDRMCKPLTECSDWQFEVTAPTDFTDRHCLNLTVCEEGEWALFKSTKMMDRVCELHTTCGEGEEVVVEGNANRDFVCAPIPVSNATNTSNYTTFAATDNTANPGETAGSTLGILLALGVLFGGVYYVRIVAGNSIANEKHQVAEVVTGAGKVEADDAETPFVGGDFWFNEESGVEVLPLAMYLRQPVLRPSKKVISLSDDDSDDEVMGTYDIAGAAEADMGGITLLSQSQYGQPPMTPMSPIAGIQGQLQQHAAIVNSSYQQVLPGMDMTQLAYGGGGMPQIPSPMPAPVYQSPVQPFVPAVVAPPAMPNLGINMSALGPLPTLDVSAVGAPAVSAPVAVAAPPADDEEDTKL
eukprot:gene17832-26593_t